MKGRAVLFSRSSDEWATPPALFQQIAAEFGPFTLDPCATPESAKCTRFYTRDDDGLTQSWAGARVFVNPPFSEVGEWIRKARHAAAMEGAFVVCLVAARTGSRWWHEHVIGYADVRFLRGRVKFGGSPHNAPFDCALVIYRGKRDEHAAVIRGAAKMYADSLEATDPLAATQIYTALALTNGASARTSAKREDALKAQETP